MFHLLKTLFPLMISYFGENGPRKMAEKSTYKKIKKKQYLQRRISENTDLKKIIIQKELESINLGATNGTFITKGEIESNIVTKLTDKPN